MTLCAACACIADSFERFDAVIECYNAGDLDRWQEIWHLAIGRTRTSRRISAKCGSAGLKAVPGNM